MSVGSVLIGLQASRRDGRAVTSTEFLAPFAILPYEVASTRANGGEWASGMIYFAVIRQNDFAHIDTSADAGAPVIAFESSIAQAFRTTAEFLDKRSPIVTSRIRSAGLSLRIFIDVRMDQDQMELELPPDFLAACGRHELGIYVISNDIPAAEILAAGEA